MNIKNDMLRRLGFGLSATAVVLAALFPALSQLADAAQVSSRSIEISDAAPSHTSTSYLVNFTPTTTGAQSMVIDFCSNSSIIGGACTAPAGMDAKTSLGFTAGTGTTNWAVSTAAPASNSTVLVNKGTGAALGTTAITFTLTGITNPSATGTFWARVYTYSDASYGSTGTAYTTPTALGSYVDYGGFALSTTSLINISATVMETLTFCVNKLQPGNGCTTLTTPVNLTLGHGSPQILDSTAVDTDTAYFQISTNALSGATVNMKTRNTCSGLSRNGGVDTCPIPGIGATATPAAATADFGLHLTTVAGGTGAVTATANYVDSVATAYGMGANVTTTYGDTIANTGGAATANVNEKMTFAAQASVTTPAGVYTAAESLIATGTF